MTCIGAGVAGDIQVARLVETVAIGRTTHSEGERERKSVKQHHSAARKLMQCYVRAVARRLIPH